MVLLVLASDNRCQLFSSLIVREVIAETSTETVVIGACHFESVLALLKAFASF